MIGTNYSAIVVIKKSLELKNGNARVTRLKFDLIFGY